MEQDVLDFLNSKIREEHGSRVTMESKWSDAEVDSFGTTMVFLEMDEKYKKFSNDWFRGVDNWVDIKDANGSIIKNGITVREIVERALDESIVVQSSSAE